MSMEEHETAREVSGGVQGEGCTRRQERRVGTRGGLQGGVSQQLGWEQEEASGGKGCCEQGGTLPLLPRVPS